MPFVLAATREESTAQSSRRLRTRCCGIIGCHSRTPCVPGGETEGVSERDAVHSGEKLDWVAWHTSYADPGSSLSRRLAVVRTRIGQVLDAAVGGRPIDILSLCAGDGRDVLPELVARPSLSATTTLVELDDRLAAAAQVAASTLAGVQVRHGDAGDVATFEDVLPVDLLLLCGIFGNISTTDIRATVAAMPSMLAAGGTVIWTRGWFAVEDLRPTIRRWFLDAGLNEISFDGEPERFGVGVAREQDAATRADHALAPVHLHSLTVRPTAGDRGHAAPALSRRSRTSSDRASSGSRRA